MKLFSILFLQWIIFATCYTVPPLLQQLRQKYGVPNDCSENSCKLIIVGHEAHMDWDWLLPFGELCNNTVSKYWNYYYSANSEQIIGGALELMENSSKFHWNIAEMGFLRDFKINKPNEWTRLLQVKSQLHIVGGGIVAPDNELVHGEAFIRNYLSGLIFLNSGDSPIYINFTNVWLEDDFGHDPQLPVVLEAMGIDGIGFARIPGAPDQGNNGKPIDGSPSLADQLRDSTSEGDKIKGGVDFVWTADDNSTVIAHWLMNHYDRGFHLDGLYFGWKSPFNCFDQDGTCLHTNWQITNFNLFHMLSESAPISPLPLIYIHASEDFARPKQIFETIVDNWNAKSANGSGYNATNAWAILGSFNDYVDAIKEYSYQNYLNSRPFSAIPFWMGQYTTRPFLKEKHHRITKQILSCELLLSIALANGMRNQVSGIQETIDDLWTFFSPSMHHDFVTGTATVGVYTGEQLPLLQQSDENSLKIQQKLMAVLTSNIESLEMKEPVVVFNPVGMARSGIFEIPIPKSSSFEKIVERCKHAKFCQVTNDSLLIPLELPAFGYKTIDLANPSIEIPKFLSVTQQNDSLQLENDNIIVIVKESLNWGIYSLYDKLSKKFILNSDISKSPANEIRIFNDTGDFYQYGFEYGFPFDEITKNLINSTAFISESGPQRVSICTRVWYQVFDQILEYERNYSLIQGEKILRMSLTGKALANNLVQIHTPLVGNSILISFPMLNFNGDSSATISTISRGTPYHHDSKPLVRYWDDLNFYITHNFALAKEGGNFLGGFYHDFPRSWAISADNSTLYGGFIRNPAQDPCGFCDTDAGVDCDPDVHTIYYAFRIPYDLQDPTTLQPLLESLNYHSPIITSPISESSPILPSNYSLASVTGPSLLTAVKPKWDDTKKLIFRVYQSSNSVTSVSLSINATCVSLGSATEITALERETTNRFISSIGDSVSLELERALVSLQFEMTC